jgi:putative SOS response-associated peptidase YedK
MTAEPNGIVEPIHGEEMPVLLMKPDEVDRWLEGNVADVLAMQRPAPMT